MTGKIRILLLSANPLDTVRLQIGEEMREIEQGLRTAPRGRSFQLIPQLAVRPQDLSGSLLLYEPDIVHFSGHATSSGVILQDKDGHARPVDGKLLANLLGAFRQTLRLVFLNACFTLSGSWELGEVIDYTVGTTSNLADETAIRFSSCFYRALGCNKSVQEAFELAKHQTILEEVQPEMAFTLIVRPGVDATEPFLKSRAVAKRATVSVNEPVKARSSGKRAVNRAKETPSGAQDVQQTSRGVSRSGHQAAVPGQIRESLAAFQAEHLNSDRVAFLIMQFGTTAAHQKIVDSIREGLANKGMTALRADDKQYHDDLFANVLTYIYGCGFAIAVFERLEREQFNPNVALEVGYMFALGKQVCLLKDKTLSTLHADLVGRLYREFDPQNPEGTIPTALNRWLGDKGLWRKP
jgi:CHAT domain-containing protein